MSVEKMAKTTGSVPWPENGLEYLDRCPICSSPTRELLYSGLTDRVFFCAPGEWTLMRCLGCSSGYLNPRPTPETIGMAYQTYFTHENAQETTGSAPAGLTQKIRWAFGNGYRNWRFGTRSRPAFSAGLLAVLLSPERRSTIDASMRHLPKPKEGQTLLDFGCGNGEFLQRALAAGWKAVGFDFDAQAVRAARANGLETHEGGIESLEQCDQQFDVITLSHVVEHVHDPRRLLRACYHKLKSGGILWIETPNLNSQGHKIFGKNWRALEPPRHLVLFNPKSLFLLLKEVGFKSVEHQREHPAVPIVFGASEAIQREEDPIEFGGKYARANEKKWNREKKKSRKFHNEREFITVMACK
jgi:SAM-dependent methyltransferase